MALIAGGVGIAPLIGILRQLRLDGDRRPAVLEYGNRIEDQIVHRDELEALEDENGTRIIHVLSEPPEGWTGRTGMIDANLIREVFADPATRDWVFVTCGPPGMMEVVEETLAEMGVPARQVLSERFSYD